MRVGQIVERLKEDFHAETRERKLARIRADVDIEKEQKLAEIRSSEAPFHSPYGLGR